MDPNVQQPQQPVAPQSVQPQVPQIAPSASWSPLPKVLLSILGVIVVLGLIGGAYYLGTQQNANVVSYQKTAVVPTTPISVAPTNVATPTADPTATWKVYSDASNGLSIKYPTDWGYDTALLATLKTVVFGQGNYKIPLQTEARPPVALTTKGEQYDVVIKRTYWDNQKQQTASFAGLTGVYISGTNTQQGPGQGFSGGEYILNKNGIAIELSYNVINGIDYGSIAQQMIQTLKVN